METRYYLRSFSLFLWICVAGKIPAQAPAASWAVTFGGIYHDGLSSIAVNPLNGDVYSTGYFSQTVDFDPGPGIFNITPLSHDIFIVKHDSSGQFIWANSIGGWGDDGSSTITFDTSGGGFIYITGEFRDTVDFDPGEGVFNLYVSTIRNFFITKWDADGNFLWAKSIVGESAVIQSLAIDHSDSSNIYVCGVYNESMDADPGDDSLILTSLGYWNLFVIKLTQEGNFIWAKSIGGTRYTGGNDIAIDQVKKSGIYITGSFEDLVDFDPGDGVYNLNTTGPHPYIYVLKLDKNGEFMWVKSIGNGVGRAVGDKIVVDPYEGEFIYITGIFNGETDFNPDSSGAYFLNTPYSNYFLLKLNSSGNFVWARSQAGGRELAVDKIGRGHIYVTGSFNVTNDFDPGPEVFNVSPTSDYLHDIYLTQFDTAGYFGWVKTIGGTDYDNGISVDVDKEGHVFLGGHYSSDQMAFDSETILNTSTNRTPDIFIAKVSNSISTSTTDSKATKILIYPNPVHDELTIQFEENQMQNIELVIYNLCGRIIHSALITGRDLNQKTIIDLSKIYPGLYFLELDVDGSRSIYKFLKQ